MLEQCNTTNTQKQRQFTPPPTPLESGGAANTTTASVGGSRHHRGAELSPRRGAGERDVWYSRYHPCGAAGAVHAPSKTCTGPNTAARHNQRAVSPRGAPLHPYTTAGGTIAQPSKVRVAETTSRVGNSYTAPSRLNHLTGVRLRALLTVVFACTSWGRLSKTIRVHTSSMGTHIALTAVLNHLALSGEPSCSLRRHGPALIVTIAI